MAITVHLCAERRGQEPGLSGTDLRESFGYCLYRAVVLDEGTSARRSRALCHVPFI
jgi:hypothetical protein